MFSNTSFPLILSFNLFKWSLGLIYFATLMSLPFIIVPIHYFGSVSASKVMYFLLGLFDFNTFFYFISGSLSSSLLFCLSNLLEKDLACFYSCLFSLCFFTSLLFSLIFYSKSSSVNNRGSTVLLFNYFEL